MLTKEEKAKLVDKLQNLLVQLSEAYVCPLPEDCREGDSCYYCDIYRQGFDGFEALISALTSNAKAPSDS